MLLSRTRRRERFWQTPLILAVIWTILLVGKGCDRNSCFVCHAAFSMERRVLRHHSTHVVAASSSSRPSVLRQKHPTGCPTRRTRMPPPLAVSVVALYATSNTNHPEPNIIDNDDLTVWTRSQLDAFCTSQGVELELVTVGPGYRAMARSSRGHEDEDTTPVLGKIEGFVRPTGNLLHLDSMRVDKAALTRARRENDAFTGGGTRLGVGLLLGYLCLLHGRDQGCTTAEFLAIDDEDYQHKRLVKYYRHSGFEIVKYVGDDVKSIPDRLVWGGCGTLLRQDIPLLLRKWTKLMERSERHRLKQQQQAGATYECEQ